MLEPQAVWQFKKNISSIELPTALAGSIKNSVYRTLGEQISLFYFHYKPNKKYTCGLKPNGMLKTIHGLKPVAIQEKIAVFLNCLQL